MAGVRKKLSATANIHPKLTFRSRKHLVILPPELIVQSVAGRAAAQPETVMADTTPMMLPIAASCE